MTDHATTFLSKCPALWDHYKVQGTVVPDEVVVEGEFRWDMRGFTRTIERNGQPQLQEYRVSRGEGGVKKGAWLDVFDTIMAQTSMGPMPVSIEGDYDVLHSADRS